MRLRVWALFAFSVGFLTLGSFGTLGQAGSGDLTGEVRDASGGLLAGAKVTLRRSDTQETYATVSTVGGVYSFSGLKPGGYAVSVELTGFKKLLREGIVVTTGNTTRVDLQVAVGSVTETVTVEGDAASLKTESATLGQSFDAREIPALPLNGRTFINLIALAPGVQVPPGSSLPRLSGSRPRTNEYQYDGIGVLQPEPGQVAFFPIVDAIQEFNVETSVAPAQFGRFNGGVINLTTKSGSNDYHGSVFEFLRNEKLNARNVFAPATAANPNKPEFRRNQFGFVAGGPIIREKTFFFADYQGTRQLIGRVVTSTVPTQDERDKGDFSKLLGLPLFRDPSNNNAVTTNPTNSQGNPNNPIMATDTGGNTIQVRQNMIFRPSDHLAYAGNVIPVNTFDAAAANLLSFYPLPTNSALANNFSRIANEPDNQDQFDIRLDHRFEPRPGLRPLFVFQGFHVAGHGVFKRRRQRCGRFAGDRAAGHAGAIGGGELSAHVFANADERSAIWLYAAACGARGTAALEPAFAEPGYTGDSVKRSVQRRVSDVFDRGIPAAWTSGEHRFLFSHRCNRDRGHRFVAARAAHDQVRYRQPDFAAGCAAASVANRVVHVQHVVHEHERCDGNGQPAGQLFAGTSAAILD